MAGTLPRFNRSVDFAVPASAGNYAPEVLYFAQNNTPAAGRPQDILSEFQVLIGTLVASAQVEVDLLKPEGDPTQAGDWRTIAIAYTTAGLKDAVALARIYGGRVRVKSGGTAGTQTVDAWWW